MICLSEQLKALRRARDLTQEEVAGALHVSPQSVSKWERGESTPDIALLPALANYYETSIDALFGMDELRSDAMRRAAFAEAHRHFREGEYAKAEAVLRRRLDAFPGDAGLTSELAFCLCFDPRRLSEAIHLSEDILRGSAPEKVRHTVRAALVLMLEKQGETDRAEALAATLPHARESRERIRAIIDSRPAPEQLDAAIRALVLGDEP